MSRMSPYVTYVSVCHYVTTLHLHYRGYSGKKLSDNLECEIMQTILEEAHESYPTEIVHELSSNTPDELEQNLNRILLWIEEWKHGK